MKSLDNLLVDTQTKCNIVILMQQSIYASIRKFVRIFVSNFYFRTVVANTTLELILLFIS